MTKCDKDNGCWNCKFYTYATKKRGFCKEGVWRNCIVLFNSKCENWKKDKRGEVKDECPLKKDPLWVDEDCKEVECENWYKAYHETLDGQGDYMFYACKLQDADY